MTGLPVVCPEPGNDAPRAPHGHPLDAPTRVPMRCIPANVVAISAVRGLAFRASIRIRGLCRWLPREHMFGPRNSLSSSIDGEHEMSAASFDVSDVPGTDRVRGPAAYRDEDFPGCESFHLPASELDRYERRLEFWDGATETAWRIPDTPIQHEGPSRQFVQMTTQVEMLRGSTIGHFGSSDLVRFDATGRKRWLMQADEMLYLHPERWRRLQGPAIDVDADPLPDVVLEVDHTTDVRRRKLDIYKESGFPEIWVLVPWESSARTPGLTIHVCHGEEYWEKAASRAFSGWRAEEIYRALTESPLSETAWHALARVALGALKGTKPEDDPLMASVLARPWAKGYREGLVQGRIEAVAQVLEARGIEAALDATEDRELLGSLTDDALAAAALSCTDAADFRRRLRREQRSLHGRGGTATPRREDVP